MTSHSHQAVCIVTGGSLGIGAAICQLFAQMGYLVFNLDLQAPNEPNPSIRWRECDVSNVTQVKNIIADIRTECPKIDCLISNAGVHLSADIEHTSEDVLDKMFAINVKGAYAALIAKQNSFAYNLTKSALASIAKTTALDYAKYKIRANAVCPGTIETPLYHNAIDSYLEKSGRDSSEVHAEEAALQPLGRLGQPDEVAQLCYFLAGEHAQFITGSLQVIDGGYTTQ